MGMLVGKCLQLTRCATVERLLLSGCGQECDSVRLSAFYMHAIINQSMLISPVAS